MQLNVENTSMYFLRRDELWQHIKPYELKFDPPDAFPKTNATPDKCDGIRVEDIRGREADFTIKENGFTVMRLDASVTLQDFQTLSGDDLAERYFKPLSDALKRLMGAERVQIFDFQVRKSHPEFPISTGEPYDFQQPSTILHIDTTPQFTSSLVEKLNPNSPELLRKRHQYVNVWKPLKGPVRSWPLAVCDTSSVNTVNDLQARDIVYPEGPVESFWVHPSSGYKFYYLSEQQTNETMVILQSDSKGYTGVPHTAFPNPWAVEDKLGRESVEVRALVFYGDDGDNK